MKHQRLNFLVWLILAAVAFGIILIAAPGLAGPGDESGRSTFIVGGDHDYPPYEFLDENGHPTGYNAELTRAIAKVMGLNVEIRLGPWRDIRSGLESGELDVIHGMFFSKERDKLVDFSTPHTVVSHAIFARHDSPPIGSVEHLRGKEIIVMGGDIMHDYVLENGLSDNPVVVATQADALRLLASGKHDCALIAKLPGLYWVKELKLSNITTVGPPIRPSEYCYAVTEGNTALLARFSEGLAIVRETGRYREISKRWLGVLEPRGIPGGVILKYAAIVLIPLSLLLTGLVLWNWTLKKKVAGRTAELEAEVAERKRAEETLRQSKDKHQNLSRALDLGLSEVFQALDEISSGNPDVTISETSEIELISELKHVVNLTAENIGEIVALSHEFAMGLAEHFDVLHRASEGDLAARILGTSHVELLGALKEVTNHMIESVFKEVTDRQQAQEALKEYSERLEEMVEERTRELREAQGQVVYKERLATLGQVAGGVAHELRNPLAAIRNAAYFLSMAVSDAEPEVKEALEILEGEVLASERTIKSLLDFARREFAVPREVDLPHVVQGALSRVPVPENVDVVTQSSETLPIIWADPEHLTQAFENLTLNALQAMPEGGQFMIKYATPSPEQVAISFTDTGVGMEQGALSRAFEPLFTTKAKGIGLGLTLTKMLVEAHGGTIKAESEQGKGSTFSVSLPTRFKMKGAKILVVDDDKQIRDLLTEGLTTLRRYQTEEASSGTQALIKLGTCRPDVLILDIMMPEMDGLEVCRAIRSDPQLSHMNVIIITGFPDDHKLKEVAELGFANIHTKPIELQRLTEEVDKVLKLAPPHLRPDCFY